MLVPYQHVEALKLRYGLKDYDIGETIGGMLKVMMKKRHVREAMTVFDACQMTNLLVLADIRRKRGRTTMKKGRLRIGK